VKIRLGNVHGCISADECRDTAAGLHEQLACGRYDWPVSLLRLDDFNDWHAGHRTARKRAARASRLGYYIERIERAQHIDEIHRINTSKPVRQGRPMTASYQERPSFSPLPGFPCRRHRIDQWGIFAPSLIPPDQRVGGEQISTDPILVGYLVAYVSGDLLMVSQILGHADHLDREIMYLLVATVLRESPHPAVAFYNRHDSGTDGLRFFKERLGFHADRAEWTLQ